MILDLSHLHAVLHRAPPVGPGWNAAELEGLLPDAPLREAAVLVGLVASQASPVGFLDPLCTITGFRVLPLVAMVDPEFVPRPDPGEVAEVFEVPLDFLLDTRNHRYESAFFKGRMRKYWAMPYGERFIWGATAGMLVTFHRILIPKPVARTDF